MGVIGDLLGGIGSLVGAGASLGLGYAQLEQSKEQFEYNKGVDLRNYYQRKQEFDYEKALQQRIFDREDTSLQRRMDDAKAAGLNPYSVLQLGGAGTGSAVNVSAPQENRQQSFTGFSDMAQSVLQAINVASQVKNMQLDIEQREQALSNEAVENELLQSKVVEQSLSNKVLEDAVLSSRINVNSQFLDLLRHSADFNYDFGTDFAVPQMIDDNGYHTYFVGDFLRGGNTFGDRTFGTGGTWYDSIRNFEYDDRYYGRESKRLDYERKGYLNESAKYAAELARKESEWYNVGKGAGLADKLLGFVMQGLSMYRKYKH